MADAVKETPHPDPPELQLRRLPLVPLRDDVVFPKLIVPLSVGRRTSIAAISFAMDHDKQVLLVAQALEQRHCISQMLHRLGGISGK